MKKNLIIAFFVLFLIYAYVHNNTSQETIPNTHVTSISTPLTTKGAQDKSNIDKAIKHQRSHIQVEGSGRVIKVLRDDLKGSRHQKFLLRIASGKTILVAHNIDLSPRIDNLQKGDTVKFYGQYEWTAKGGVVHWTHKDPRNQHVHGWLKHNGRVYQ